MGFRMPCCHEKVTDPFSSFFFPFFPRGFAQMSLFNSGCYEDEPGILPVTFS
jgi:hypothetical protein